MFINEPSIVVAIVSGGTTVFPFKFKWYAEDNIQVYHTLEGEAPDDKLDLLESTDYSISSNASKVGGDVTITKNIADGDTITISRVLLETRTIDFAKRGSFTAIVINQDQDYQTYLIKDLREFSDLFLRLPVSGGGTGEPLIFPSAEPDAYIKYDATGENLVGDTTIPEGVLSAELSKNQALAEALTAESYAVEFVDGAGGSNEYVIEYTWNDVDKIMVGTPQVDVFSAKYYEFNARTFDPDTYFSKTEQIARDDAQDAITSTNKSMTAVSKQTTGTISLSITPTHSEASTITTADYVVDNIIQVDATGDFYTCILASTTGELLTNATYFTLSHADIETTGVQVGYSKGYDSGAVNTSNTLADGSKTLNGVTPSADNYGYTEENDVDNIYFTPIEPVAGNNNKRTSAVNPDVYVDGKYWDSSNGGEKVTNWNFGADTDWTKGIGWTIGSGVASSDGTQVADSLLTTTVPQTREIGEVYTIGFEITAYTAGNVSLKFEGIEVISDKSAIGIYTEDVIATTTNGATDIVADLNFVGSVDNVTSFEKTIKPDTAYTIPITYLSDDNGMGIIEADSAGFPALLKPWQPATLVEKRLRANEIDIFVVDDDYIDLYAVGANPQAKLYNDGTVIGITDNGSYRHKNGEGECYRYLLKTTNQLATGVSFSLPLILHNAKTSEISYKIAPTNQNITCGISPVDGTNTVSVSSYVPSSSYAISFGILVIGEL